MYTVFERDDTPLSPPIEKINGNEGEHITDPNLVPVLNFTCLRWSRSVCGGRVVAAVLVHRRVGEAVYDVLQDGV